MVPVEFPYTLAWIVNVPQDREEDLGGLLRLHRGLESHQAEILPRHSRTENVLQPPRTLVDAKDSRYFCQVPSIKYKFPAWLTFTGSYEFEFNAMAVSPLTSTIIRRMSTNETLRNAKRELRAAVAKRLDALDAESVREQSRTVVSLLTGLPEYQQARRVSIYLSMPAGEIDTTAIVQDALEQGKRVFIPFTHKAMPAPTPGEDQKPSVMDMVSLESLEDYQGLKRNNWGIPTPTKKSLETRKNCMDEIKTGNPGLDLIVMPGVAFDGECRRLGHGKGYYDYFLRRYSERTDGKVPFTVGVALKDQFLVPPESVPVGDKDWPLDTIIVGDGKVIRRR
ncbi:hypothetical protein TWF481_004628 [Arthrobotrys musiformis]|uniref:5-formyltetrahydrofolate cyclo-ligase n=1 Tax=Arthrobotrys musiformis TaxID=47236 RepID=A0AAV9WKH7_9PEZI